MSEAFCRKIFKGVALAGAGVALGAAVVSFSLKRVSAASKKSVDDNHQNQSQSGVASSKSPASSSGQRRASAKSPTASASSSSSSSNAAATRATSVAAVAAPSSSSSSLKGSTSSLATIKSGRHPSASSTASGLSRSGSSSWDLHGSAASLVSCSSDYDEASANGVGGSSDGSGSSNGVDHQQRPAKWNYNWDLRDPSFTNRNRPKCSRHLFFILHGHYISNGETNLHFLSSLGKTQLELTGKRLVTLGLPFSRIYHSSALRCKQSVCILRGHLPSMETVEDDLLLECAAESVTSNHRQVANRKKNTAAAAEAAAPPSSFYEDGARIEAAFRKYLHRAELKQKSDSYEVFVTHANVIRYFVCRALQLPPEAWLRMSLHNGSITWLSIRPDGLVFVRELGDTGHMPANDELKNPDGSLILTKMPSKMQSWYLHESKEEDEYYGTVQS